MYFYYDYVFLLYMFRFVYSVFGVVCIVCV